MKLTYHYFQSHKTLNEITGIDNSGNNKLETP